MWNLTLNIRSTYKYFTYLAAAYFNERRLVIKGSHVKKYNNALRVKNSFGDLHFGSCGSRGIQPFPFVQFVSFCDWEICVFIFASTLLLYVAIVNLYKDSKHLISFATSILSILKALLEQGYPFSTNFEPTKPMKFILSGILFAGLVQAMHLRVRTCIKLFYPTNLSLITIWGTYWRQCYCVHPDSKF